MKQRKKIGKVMLSFVLSFSMILSVMMTMIPAMEVKAADDYKSLKNTTTVVKFDGKDWYLIGFDDSTVTLLSKDCVAASQYNSSGSYVEYGNSTVKTAVVDYYNTLSENAKTAVSGEMFLLTTAQANAITNAEVRKCSQATGASYNWWWLSSKGTSYDYVATVFGGSGRVSEAGSMANNNYGVRPALKLKLSSVIFSSNTFTVATPVSSISISPDMTQSVDIDSKISFTATVSPNNATDKTVKWSTSGKVMLYSDENCTTPVGSDATSTLTVYAKGVTAGDDAVTVTSNANAEKSASCNVTVNKKAGTISYATTSVSKTNGDAAFTNVLTNTGDGAVSYASDNTAVATVNAETGEVTIQSYGEANITATVTDGDNYTYATKTASYKLTVAKRSYEVKFDANGHGTAPASQNVEEDGKATKPADLSSTDYDFTGWYKESACTNKWNFDTDTVTEATTIFAGWKIKTFTVTWTNYDDTVLNTDTVNYGATPTYTGETPTKPADAQYTYTFVGWTPAIDAATGDVTYKATYTNAKNKYTVRWLNYDNTVLQEGTVDYGETPEYTGDTPTKPADEQYTYTFLNWTPVVIPVVDNVVYVATYTQTEIKKDDGEKVVSTEVKKDEKSPEVKAANLTDELAESIISSEEKADIKEAINNGEDVKVDVYLEIKDISDAISASDKEKIKASATNAANIEYFDISLFKEISISGQSKGATSIHELTTPLKLTIGIPKSFPAVADGYKRNYVVLRLHDGSVTVLPATLNADGTLSFETDKFSTYALAYTDTKKEEATAKAPKKDTPKAPTTGDKINMGIIVMLMIDSSLAALYLTLKRKQIK